MLYIYLIININLNMAFVFREERKANLERPKSSLGPGEYLPITETKKVKLNKIAPFETKSQRLKSASPNFNPGPGTYYTNDSLLKQQQIKIKAQIRQMNQDNHLTQEQIIAPYDTMYPIKTKYKLNNNKEQLGFDVKDKRFKSFTNDNPGPGEYNTITRAASAKPQSMRNQFITAMHKSKSKKSKISAPSIPQKEDYGFDIDSEGKLIRIYNPDNYKHFKGEGGDCVGPGSYQLDNPSTWHKKGPSWSKMKSSRINSAVPPKFNNSDTNITIHKTNNKHLKGNISKNTTRPGTAFDMRMMSAKTQKSQTIINNNNNISVSRIASANREKRKANIKKLYNDDILYDKNKDANTLYYEEFIKFTNKQNPGPGYYIDINKESAFHSTPYPEHRQFFGSNKERFPNPKHISEVGPSTYFQDQNNTNILETYKQSTKQNIPFSSKAPRFGVSKYDNINLAYPGPGTYDPIIKSQIEKNHFNNNVTSFNLRQNRFDDKYSNIKSQMNTPGPGSYINPYTASGTANTVCVNGMYIEIRKGKELIRKKSLSHSTHSQMPQQQQHQRDMSPDVGSYDPYKTMTIAYNAKKNAKVYKCKGVAFCSHSNKDKKEPKSNLGPGFYYKEKKYIKEQISPPFYQSDIKFRQNEKHSVGPGQYDTRSYFDWNKKTFNITFI